MLEQLFFTIVCLKIIKNVLYMQTVILILRLKKILFVYIYPLYYYQIEKHALCQQI